MNRARKGADFERQVADLLGDDGYFTIRSAGSHGPADLAAFKRGFCPACGHLGVPDVTLLQCKTDGALRRAERIHLVTQASAIAAVPVLVHKPDRGRLSFEELTGLGPRDREPWTPDEIAYPTGVIPQ